MLATVLLDPPAAAGAAALFTLLAARSIARSAQAGAAARRAESRRNVQAGMLLGGFLALCFAWHAFRWPAWMLVYAINPTRFPAVLWYPIFGLALVVGGGAGAFFADALIARGRLAGAAAAAGVFLAACALCFALTWQRARVFGTFEEFWADAAVPIGELPEVQRATQLAGLAAALGLGTAAAARLLAQRRAGPS